MLALLTILLSWIAQQPAPQPTTGAAAAVLDFEFYRSRVQPMLLVKREGRVRCATCHAGAASSQLRLQPMSPGASDWNEAESRKNFEALARFVTPGEPTASRLLMHPLDRRAGGDPFHGGGKHWMTQDDPEWQILAQWVRAAGARSTGPAQTAAITALDFDVYRSRVEPIFLKARGPDEGAGSACATCHSTVATRMRLQPPPAGGAAWSVEDSRLNFAVVSRLVSPGDPMKSPLLLHPLAQAAGGDAQHSGGKFWRSQDHPEWQTIAAWVRAASSSSQSMTASISAEAALDFEMFRTRVQPILLTKREGLVRCVTCHAGAASSQLRLQPLSPGASEWNEAESRKNFAALSRFVTPGDPMASRFLMHPLDRRAGGDPFHGGGKHWTSQDDPEWRTLAEWVRASPK